MLELIEKRLEQSGLFASVDVAESIEAISAAAAVAPENNAIFVAPWRERAHEPANATGGHRQKVDMQFVTALVIRRYDDPRGGERARNFDQVKTMTEGLLAGWQPIEGGWPIMLTGAEVTGFGNGVSILAQTWQVSRFLTGAT